MEEYEFMYDCEEMLPLTQLDESLGSEIPISERMGSLFEGIAREAGAEFLDKVLIEARFDPNQEGEEDDQKEGQDEISDKGDESEENDIK